MQLSKILAKLMAIDSQMHDLQPEQDPAPTNHEPDLRDDSNRPSRSITGEQRLLALYKVMDMGA